jgi:hypothetical protein
LIEPDRHFRECREALPSDLVEQMAFLLQTVVSPKTGIHAGRPVTEFQLDLSDVEGYPYQAFARDRLILSV